MYKNNGFTLIELLAVIVILAIIIVISVPNVLNIIEDVKKEAFKNNTYGIIEAAELEYSKNLTRGKKIDAITYTYSNGQEFSSTGEKLEYKGAAPKKWNSCN